ncbi:MAG TPA: hypothetical protein VF883_05480 [Thermoanaerobaculia bacterium]|jgi:hypothetical protein
MPIVVEALLLHPAKLLNPDYRVKANIAIRVGAPWLTKLVPHTTIQPGVLTIGGVGINDDSGFPGEIQAANDAAVSISDGNADAHATLANALECGEWRDLLLATDDMRALLLFHGQGDGSGEEAALAEDEGRDAHLEHCWVHLPPEREEDEDPAHGCAFVRSGPRTLDVTSGRGLPKPEMRDPRYVFKHGPGNWPRLRFVTHHLMSGDRYTMMTTLVLYPMVYVELIYCDIARIKGHSDFFCSILPGRRAEFQVLQTEVEKKRPPSAPEPQDAEGYYHYVKPDDRSVLVGTYWENPTAMGLSTYMVGQAFHEDAAGSRRRLMSAVTAAVAGPGRTGADSFLDQRFDRAGLYIVLWIRNEGNGPEWNMTVAAYEQLVATAREVRKALDQPVRIVCCGSRLTAPYVRGGTPPGGLLNMIEFWDEGDFPKQYGRAAQIYFWHRLASKDGVHCVFLGMRSGALEQLAIVGLPTIFMEPKSQAKTERADRMRQWIGRLPYSRCIIDEYLCDPAGEPRSGAGTFSDEDLTSIKVMLYDALRRQRTRDNAPEKVEAKKLRADRARRRQNQLNRLHYPSYIGHKQTDYYYDESEDRMSLYAAFAVVTGKLMVPRVPEDIDDQVQAVIKAAAENSILKYAIELVKPHVNTAVNGALATLARDAARAAIRDFGRENQGYYEEQQELLDHLALHGAVVTFDAGPLQALQPVVRVKELLVDYYARRIGRAVLQADEFEEDLREDVNVERADLVLDKLANDPVAPAGPVLVLNFPSLVTAYALDQNPNGNALQQFGAVPNGFDKYLGKLRMAIAVADLIAVCDQHLDERTLDDIEIDVHVRTLKGLTSKREATEAEHARVVRYEWIEGEDAVREEVARYEDDEGKESGDPQRHVDPERMGTLGDDEYWLACCFDQPITLHFPSLEKRSQLVGPRGSNAQSVHILVLDDDAGYRPLYRAV